MATPSRARQVIVRAPAARVRDLFRRLASLPRGTRVRPLLVRVGLATLQVIHEAFLVKAGGRADDAGVRWQALSPVTVRLSPRRRQPVEILRDRDALEESLNPADPEAGWTRAPRRVTTRPPCPARTSYRPRPRPCRRSGCGRAGSGR